MTRRTELLLEFILAVAVLFVGHFKSAYGQQVVRPCWYDATLTTCNSYPSASSGFPVSGDTGISPTDCSGTITTGGTAQNAFSAQQSMHGFMIMNLSTSEPLWFSMTTTAAAAGTGSYVLPPGVASTYAGAGSFTTPLGLGIFRALSVIAATTGHPWTCTWW